jgi:hypothetical protein
VPGDGYTDANNRLGTTSDIFPISLIHPVVYQYSVLSLAFAPFFVVSTVTDWFQTGAFPEALGSQKMEGMVQLISDIKQ